MAYPPKWKPVRIDPALAAVLEAIDDGHSHVCSGETDCDCAWCVTDCTRLDAGSADDYGESHPNVPTDTEPGSVERERVQQRRVERHQSVANPADRMREPPDQTEKGVAHAGR